MEGGGREVEREGGREAVSPTRGGLVCVCVLTCLMSSCNRLMSASVISAQYCSENN